MHIKLDFLLLLRSAHLECFIVRHTNILYSIIGVLFFSTTAKAYPDFIGYSYSSCITCHYSGSGGGPLNDYGRALFATEIAARDIYSSKTDEETIAAQSGFLGSAKLPWWIRPGLKYRGLWLQTDPNSAVTKERFINMQNDINLALFGDKKQRLTFVATATYADEYPPSKSIKKWGWFAKEYFVRWKQNNNLWLYAGQMDKTFGIRHADHTSYNRSPIELGQYDQSQGAIVHFTYPNWDIALNAFVGNAAEEVSEKQKGGAISGEYQISEELKLGSSLLSSTSDKVAWNLFSVHTRMKISKGSSIMAEFGVRDRKNKVSGQDAELGTFGFVQTLVNFRRGYNLLTVIEHSKSDIKKPSTENLRYSLGALMFPLPRTELRLMVVNGKRVPDTGGQPDAWTLQSQLHISY
jgi:hypothetical protein